MDSALYPDRRPIDGQQGIARGPASDHNRRIRTPRKSRMPPPQKLEIPCFQCGLKQINLSFQPGRVVTAFEIVGKGAIMPPFDFRLDAMAGQVEFNA